MQSAMHVLVVVEICWEKQLSRHVPGYTMHRIQAQTCRVRKCNLGACRFVFGPVSVVTDTCHHFKVKSVCNAQASSIIGVHVPKRCQPKNYKEALSNVGRL